MATRLLVEDNELNRDMLARRPIRKHFDVITANVRTGMAFPAEVDSPSCQRYRCLGSVVYGFMQCQLISGQGTSSYP